MNHSSSPPEPNYLESRRQSLLSSTSININPKMCMERRTYILQLPDLPHYPLHLPIILALQLIQHRIAILSPTLSLAPFPLPLSTTSLHPQLTSSSASRAYNQALQPQAHHLIPPTHSKPPNTHIPQHNSPGGLGSRSQLFCRWRRRYSFRRAHCVDRADEGMSPRIYF